MTKKEAKSLIKNNAAGKYRGSALLMLSHMVDASFAPGEANAARTRGIKDSTLMGWVHIKEAQFRKLLKRFEADGLGEFSRKNGKVTYRLNLEPLKKLPAASKSKEDIKARNADRAAKARAAYAAQRKERELAKVQQFFVALARENSVELLEAPSPAQLLAWVLALKKS